MKISEFLNHPNLCHASQVLPGFFGARKRALKKLVPSTNELRILDIGCGPGHFINELEGFKSYVGFDTDAGYIDFARQKHGGKGTFFASEFTSRDAETVGEVDLVLLNGVLHHLDDLTAANLLRDIESVLVPGGRIFTLDGCYTTPQSKLRSKLLDSDRGRFVRTASQYMTLLEPSFSELKSSVDNDLSWFPYTFHVALGRKKPL